MANTDSTTELEMSNPIFQKRMKKAGIYLKTEPEKAGRKWNYTIWHGTP
jgi:hypothetical protein